MTRGRPAPRDGVRAFRVRLRVRQLTPTASLASSASWVCAALTTFDRSLWLSS